MPLILAVTLAAGAVSAGCSGGGGGGEQAAASANADEGVALDVNDVSFLFSLASPQPELLTLESAGKGGPLMTEEGFRAMMARAPGSDGGAGTFVPQGRADWRVVAARVDDCAKLKAADAGCVPQLRLIAQPFQFPNQAEDHALHLVYNLDEPGFAALLDDVVALKKASSVPTNGVPLGVHPAMRAEGPAGPFATRLKQVIAKHVGQPNLFAVAAMFTTTDPRDGVLWNFSNAAFVNGAVVSPPLPCTIAGTDRVTVVSGGASNTLRPATSTCADDLDLLVQSHGSGDFFNATPDAQAAAVSAQLRADNPALNGFGDLKCSTCHVGSRALARAKGVEFLEPGADQDPGRFVPAAGVTAAFRSGRRDPSSTTPDNASDLTGFYEVRAFGYLGAVPSYTTRTVNETAVVVDALNKKLAAQPAPAPSGG
jgi:hypothetical protein